MHYPVITHTITIQNGYHIVEITKNKTKFNCLLYLDEFIPLKVVFVVLK